MAAGGTASPRATGAGLAAALAVTTLTVTTVIGSELAIARRNLGARPERDFPGWVLAVGLLGVLAIVVAAWLLRIRRDAALGWATAVAGAVLPVWSGWSWMPDALRVAVLATTPIVVVGVLHVVIAGDSRLPPGAWVVDVLATVAVAIHLAGYNAFADRHCIRTCADVRPLADSWLTTRPAVLLSTVLTVGAAALAVVVIVRRSTAARLTTAAALVAVVSQAVIVAVRWAKNDDVTGPPELLVLVPLAAVAAVAVTICDAGARTWRTRVALAQLVDRLSGAAESVPHVGPVLGVEFALPGGAGWVDGAGHVVDALPAAEYLVINDGAGPAVRLELRGQRDAADVVAALTPATQLALRNAQLAAVARAGLADVRASRRRIVVAADAERRRIERDLHDGSQQRLVSASLHLKAAIARADQPAADVLARAEITTREALTRLRGISHGIFPSVLATGGLSAALGDLVGTTPTTSTVRVAGDVDVDAATSMAAYATVAAVLDAHRNSGISAPAQVCAVRVDGTLTVTIATEVDGDDLDPSDLADVADRVGAVGGELSVTADAHRRVVESGAAMRVVIADDVMLIRSGLAMLLADAGIAVVGEAADADGLLRVVASEQPDVAIVDIRMPPTQTDEGLVAAKRIREQHPGTAVVLLSQHLDAHYAERLLADQPDGFAYLLKERVSEVALLVDAMRRVVDGECVIDPGIVSQLMRRRRADSPLNRLTDREREILGLMAEGRSNSGIANLLSISERTVESVSAQVFLKLDLEPSPDSNRRVLAVLALLRS